MPYPKITPVYDHILTNSYFRKEVYEPEADTFLLLDALDAEAEELAARRPSHVVEIGCGSGIVITHLAMLLQQRGAGECFYQAIDVNQRALECTRETFAVSHHHHHRHSANDKPRPMIDLIRGDLSCMFSPRAACDVLLFNPPYVPTSLDELNSAIHDAHQDKSCIGAAWAGGPNGRAVVDRLLSTLHLLLTPRGRAYVIAMRENSPDDMIRLVHESSCGSLRGRIVLSRYTGEHLFVIRFDKLDAGAYRRYDAYIFFLAWSSILVNILCAVFF